jgi:hypothetical protein
MLTKEKSDAKICLFPVPQMGNEQNTRWMNE